MTFEVTPNSLKKCILIPHNVRIHKMFYLNQFINDVEERT